mgnify:CR=1 FL=1|tara:strand:- start:210 stop:506 length:297 start_codon:yes stop_codon:yes gene_type:complete
MKVADLQKGMLLRFTEKRPYKYVEDPSLEDEVWLDFGTNDPRHTLRFVQIGRPLMVYIGQESLPNAAFLGGFMKVRKVVVNGREAMIFPDQWKYVEPA